MSAPPPMPERREFPYWSVLAVLVPGALAALRIAGDRQNQVTWLVLGAAVLLAPFTMREVWSWHRHRRPPNHSSAG